MDRALESARIVNIPNNREVVHVVPRYYVVDGQDHVTNAIGMFGSRLDMETHVVTAGSSAVQNILRCVEGAGVQVDSLIVGPLAAAEAAAEREELQHGAVLVDIGGGATDIAVFVRGTLVHTAVLPVGGAQMTGDLVVALRVPQPAAEQAKIAHGHALASLVDEGETVEIDAFGAEGRKEVPKRFVAQVLQARCEELLEMVRAEVRRGAQTELLAAGAVLTGGGASVRGLDLLAEEVLELPARIGRPRHLAGLSRNIFLIKFFDEVIDAGMRMRVLHYVPNATPDERRASVARLQALAEAVLAGDAEAADRAIASMMLADAAIVARSLEPRFGGAMGLERFGEGLGAL